MGFIPAPCIDKSFLTESPLTSLEKGNFKRCTVVNGFNKDEGTLLISITPFGQKYLNSSDAPYVSKETFQRELRFILSFLQVYHNDLIIDSMEQEYVDWSIADDPEADYFDPWKYLMGDVGYSCTASMETRAHAQAGERDIYQYFFTHKPSLSFFNTPGISIFDTGSSIAVSVGPGWFDAGHGEELPFVFGFPFYLPSYYNPYAYPEEEMELSKAMLKYWTNFAKTG